MLDPFKDKSNEELIHIYKETNRIDVKQEIVNRYVPIIRSIALQMRNVYISFIEIDDIINEGVLEIMSVLDRFDESLGIKFDTFMTKRIRGMIIDIARKNDWVPRNLRKKAKVIDSITEMLYNEKGKMPSVEDIADKAEISVEDYHNIQGRAALFNVISLDSIIDETDDAFSSESINNEQIDDIPENKILKSELKEVLINSIKKLNKNEQLVISLYYLEEVSMKDIASILKLSSPRVSQIHAKAIEKLKNDLKEYLYK